VNEGPGIPLSRRAMLGGAATGLAAIAAGAAARPAPAAASEPATYTGLIYDQGGAVFNAVAYGADPTGVADSTAAIVNALNAAGTSVPGNGGTVFVPQGKYLISSPLEVPANVTLAGAGSAATRIVPASKFSPQNLNGPSGTPTPNASAIIVRASGVTIRDLLFEPSTAFSVPGKNPNPALDCVQWQEGINLYLCNIQVLSWNGWLLNVVPRAGEPTGLIVDCIQTLNSAGGIRLVGGGPESISATISNCNIEFTQSNPVLVIQSCKDVTISNFIGATQGSVQGATPVEGPAVPAIHITGDSAAIWFSNLDVSGYQGAISQKPVIACPVLLIDNEVGAAHAPLQIGIVCGQILFGTAGVSVKAASGPIVFSALNINGNTYKGQQVNVSGADIEAGPVQFVGCSFMANGYNGTGQDVNVPTTGVDVSFASCTFASTGVRYAVNLARGNAARITDCDFTPGQKSVNGAPAYARGNRGWTPAVPITGPTMSPKPLTDYENSYGCDCTVYVLGTTGTQVSVGGIDLLLNSGSFRVPAGSTINLGPFTGRWNGWRWVAI